MKFGGGAFEGEYSAGSRFEGANGTNPEELIAAAHAGCFSMALAHEMSQSGHTPDSVNTTSKVHLEKVESGFKITTVAENAKKGCPVSQLVTGAEIKLDATLVQG